MRIVAFRGKWHAVWHDDAGQRHRVSLAIAAEPARFDDARRAAADLQREIDGIAADTVAGIWSAYMQDRGDHTKNPDRLRFAWARLKPHFAHMRPDQISRTTCREYTSQRNVSNGTIIKELNALRAALRWHDKDTPAVIELPAAPPPRDKHLTKAKFLRLIEAAQDTFHLTVFLELAVATAARKEALLSLTWPQVDLQHEHGRINLGLSDGGKSRAIVPITDRLRPVLEQAQSVARTQYVVEYADRRIGSVRTSLARAAETAGVPWVTPHVLRHTSAVWMAEAGITMPEIARYLGHRDSRITERVYAKYSPDYLRRAASALDF